MRTARLATLATLSSLFAFTFSGCGNFEHKEPIGQAQQEISCIPGDNAGCSCANNGTVCYYNNVPYACVGLNSTIGFWLNMDEYSKNPQNIGMFTICGAEAGVGGSSGTGGAGGTAGAAGTGGAAGEAGSGGSSGTGGTAGTAGTGGSAGGAGTGGSSGEAGSAGSGGSSGTGGAGGTAGAAGTGGAAGEAGSGGSSGTGGTAGTAGTGGSAGEAGSAGAGGSSGAAGSAGTGGGIADAGPDVPCTCAPGAKFTCEVDGEQICNADCQTLSVCVHKDAEAEAGVEISENCYGGYPCSVVDGGASYVCYQNLPLEPDAGQNATFTTIKYVCDTCTGWILTEFAASQVTCGTDAGTGGSGGAGGSSGAAGSAGTAGNAGTGGSSGEAGSGGSSGTGGTGGTAGAAGTGGAAGEAGSAGSGGSSGAAGSGGTGGAGGSLINPTTMVCDPTQVALAQVTLPTTGEWISFEPLAPYPNTLRLALYYWTDFTTAGWDDTQYQLRCVAPNNTTGIIYCPVIPGSVSYKDEIVPKLVAPATAGDCTIYNDDPSSYYCSQTKVAAEAGKMFCSGRYRHWLNGVEVPNALTGAFGQVPQTPWAYVPKDNSSTVDGGAATMWWVNLAFLH